MKILAIDLASRLSGWAFFEDKKLISYGLIKPRPQSLTAEQRLQIIEEEVERLLDKYKPKVVVLENPAGGAEDKKGPTANWTTMAVLFMTHGVVRNILEKRKIKYEIVSPSVWSNRLSIFKRDRSGRKAGAKAYAIEHYGLSDKEEQDIYDAVCLHDCYLYLEEWKVKSSNERSAF